MIGKFPYSEVGISVAGLCSRNRKYYVLLYSAFENGWVSEGKPTKITYSEQNGTPNC